MNLKAYAMTFVAAAALVAPAAMYAQRRHPHYLSARTDLRRAQLLARVREEPNVSRNLEAAAREIEAAIHEIDNAAVVDRKDLVDRPPIDANLARKDRFRRIVDLLRSARADIEHEEDNPRAREWRNAAFKHIDEALNAVHRAAVDAHLDHELGF
ncbi:MAG TPA: hypothetical protein VGG72_23880 [Bryobacteraceae bacterium]|jgi:hypothetical protein